ncbi:MAG: protein kinase [candidate division Zixibacteria bacterium]|nr:protein kinase [candidate division Zixibacteria bacterium]
MIGRTFLHYRIDKQLAAGGMGEVYLATDTKLDRRVALKLLPETVSANPDARERLIREAKAASKLNHPNILTIYAEEEADGQDLIVMEYVPGVTLKELIERGEVGLSDAIEIALQVAEGLRAAHEGDVIHRDIKPGNIVLTPEGRVKIMDFGLATWRGTKELRDESTVSGTIAYASPEQVQAHDLDPRTDIWSFGVLLYEMLAGHRPFEEEHFTALVYAIVRETPPPLGHFRANIPAELQQVTDRCLAKSPDGRYQTAVDLIADLKRARKALESSGIAAATLPSERRPSIAVLPFANLSADPEQEYFCEGVAEDIINALTRVQGLHVASRTSAFAFKGHAEDIRSIGQKLNVETLLEGSVRKAGNKIRISAQLINVSDGYHLWSDRFDRDMEDVFTIQDEIAASITRALQVILSEDEKRAIARVPTADVRAYDYYLRGRQFFHQRRRKSLLFARQMFERAIELDHQYALAYAGVADSCSFLVHLYPRHGYATDETITHADEASRKALELDPTSAEAHAARGFALWLLNRHDESHREFEIAIQIDPSQFDAHYFYGRACFQQGRLAEAAHLFEAACGVQENHEARYFAAQTYTALGRPALAERSYQLASVAVEKHLEMNPDDARAVTMGAVSLCRLGQQAKGLEWAERALAIDADDAGVRYNVACLYALEGEKERAFGALESAIKAGFANVHWIENDPDLASLRDDPRLQELLDKLTTPD